MKQYLVGYTLTAYEISMGFGTPYTEKGTLTFEARNTETAKSLALRHLDEIGKTRFGADITYEIPVKSCRLQNGGV